MKYIPFNQIKIAPQRQRQTFDAEHISELAGSIQKIGLQNPVVLRVVGEDYTLVSGECRLRAMTDLHELGIPFRCDNAPVQAGMIPYTTLAELDPLDAEEAELDENIRRRDLLWTERAAATARLKKLREKQAIAKGLPPPTYAEIGKEVHRGKQPGTQQVNARLESILAENLHRPEVASAPTAREAFKALRRTERAESAKRIAEAVGKNYVSGAHTIACMDAGEWLKTCPDSTFDVILIDPPYGMGADSFGDSGGKATGAHGYEDSLESLRSAMDIVAAHASRITKPEAHIYVFCDYAWIEAWKTILENSGFTPFRTPLIWFKPYAVRAPWPEHGPYRRYECIVYAMKGKRPVKHLAGDVLEYGPDKNLGHAAQKPVALLKDLLSRSCDPGDKVIDFFMGSGGILEAAEELKLTCTGVEKDPAAFGIAAQRLERLKAQMSLLPPVEE